MRARASRRMTVACVAALTIATLLAPAEAKGPMPLEVQITSAEKTVRISPNVFVERVNDGSSMGRAGFEETPPPAALPEGTRLTIAYMIYFDPSQPGSVFTELKPGIVRRTYVSVSYYSTQDGAIGQIRRGGYRRLFTPGRWVRFSPAFTAMVSESLQTLPAVEPVNAPAHERPDLVVGDPADPVKTVAVFALELLPILLLAVALVFWSQRAVRRAKAAALVEETGAPG